MRPQSSERADRPGQRARVLTASCAALALGAGSLLAANPVTASGVAFGQVVEVAVTGVEREAAKEAISRSVGHLREVERLLDPAGSGGIAELNALAGLGPVPLDELTLGFLLRAGQFCLWSEGIHGPLGSRLAQLWGIGRPTQRLPLPAELTAAVELARCTNLLVDLPNGTASLAEGSSVDGGDLAVGFAIDRAIEHLKSAGVASAMIRIGDLARAVGEGPAGRGWPVELPPEIRRGTARERIWLVDQSIAEVGGRTVDIAGQSYPAYVDQRTGRPADPGVRRVVAITELAIDAQGLATTMFVAGSRNGQALLGALQPRPAVRWALGRAAGPPVLSEYRWSQLRSE